MSSDFECAFDRIRGAVTDCRAENVRYRQNEIYSLHTMLRQNFETICEAITQDNETSRSKSEAEFSLVMDAIRKSYENLDFNKTLDLEYSVKFGKNNSEKRAAVGLVALRPSTHSRLYSVLVPLVAALEAGNSVVVELDGSSPAVDRVLLEVLPTALDRDTFMISRSKIPEKAMSYVNLFVDELSRVQTAGTKIEASPARSISVLDRTGDLELAAKLITTARLSPELNSPYSPDLVLVNEYVKEAFTGACLRYASSIGPRSTLSNTAGVQLKIRQKLEQSESAGEVTIHRSEDTDFWVVELLHSVSKLTSTRFQGGSYILMLPTKSLVDSVDSQRSSSTFLASYLFGSPSVCKFIAEQVSSYASYINHIPPQLLVGPVSPMNYPHNLHPRFTSYMFSTPRPQYITSPEALSQSSSLAKLSLTELKPTGQKKGHAIGFFEQGILLGLGSTALIVLPFIGWGLFTVGKQSWMVLRDRLK